VRESFGRIRRCTALKMQRPSTSANFAGNPLLLCLRQMITFYQSVKKEKDESHMSDHPERECSMHGTDLAFVGICDPGHTITDKCVFRWFSAWSTNTWLNANPSCSSRTIRRTHRNSAIARGHQRRNGELGDSGIVPKANRWWSILP
jgi:hypothetical protein